MTPHPFAKLRAFFEKRIKEQIDRHRSVDPNANTRQIVELTFRAEKERMKGKLDKLLEVEELSPRDEEQIVIYRYAIDHLLPDLERTFKKG